MTHALAANDGSPAAVLRCRDVSIGYGEKTVLGPVSLEFRRGEITAIIGPSGCGKSSFLQALNRISDLIPGCHVRGAVWLDGTSIYEKQTDLIDLRRRVGMIFQKPNPFPISVRRNIELPLQEKGIRDRRRRTAIVQRVLEEVGLWDEVRNRLDSPALDLSGGQQQRLCIARALALEPQVLLFDEPCSALDPLSSQTVEDLIRSLCRRTTIVIVTHNLAQARRIAHHAAMFWHEAGAGRLIESGSSSDIFERPQHPVTAAYVQGVTG